MHLKKVNEALRHKITGGSEFGWMCWPDTRYLDYESEYTYASVIFNTNTQEVYCAEINDKDDKHRYRWMNPSHKDAYDNEAKDRGVDTSMAWDQYKWTDLETTEDWLEKASAMFDGKEFDTRIQVPLNLEKDELFKLMEMAHERDITLNKMVENILEEMILRHRNETL